MQKLVRRLLFAVSIIYVLSEVAQLIFSNLGMRYEGSLPFVTSAHRIIAIGVWYLLLLFGLLVIAWALNPVLRRACVSLASAGFVMVLSAVWNMYTTSNFIRGFIGARFLPLSLMVTIYSVSLVFSWLWIFIFLDVISL